MKKLLYFVSLIFFCLFSFAKLTFAQDSEVYVQVLAAGIPVLLDEPEYTQGLSNSISWFEAELAAEYYAEVSTDAGFGFVFDNSGWINLQTYTFDNLDDDTRYFYRVKARNSSGGEGPWSESVFSTQDDNAPISRVLPLDDTIYTALFNLNFEYFDQTSGVDEITLYYRRNSSDWVSYLTFSPQDSVTFNTLLTGGDGEYDFYTIAVDNVGNIEYEAPHIDASTVVNTRVPEPVPPPPPVPTPEPEPVLPPPALAPEPEVVPVKNFVLIQYVGEAYARDLDFVEIYTVNPKITGTSTALKKIEWNLFKESGQLINSGYVRSNDIGEWEIQLPQLPFGEYEFKVYFTENGVRYSDSKKFEIKESRTVKVSGYAFPFGKIFAFFNNQKIEVGETDSNGYFSENLMVFTDFEGEIIFIAYKDGYQSKYSYDFSRDENVIENIVFPPIIYPSAQRVGLGRFAYVNGYAVPNTLLKIFLNGELVDEIQSGKDGSYGYQTKNFFDLSQYELKLAQVVNMIESPKSSPSLIHIERISIPYLYKAGDLIDRRFSYFARISTLFTNFLLIVSFAITVFAFIFISSAATVSGFYGLLYDWLTFLFLFKRRRGLIIKVFGVDFGDKRGILYLIDRSTEKLVYTVNTNIEGEAYLPRMEGIYLVKYVRTGNQSWVRSIIFRKRKVPAFFNDQVLIKKDDSSVNVTFDSSEEIFIYPFEQFEKRFDRIILFVNFPIALAAIIGAMFNFYFFASIGALILIIFAMIIWAVNIFMLGYRKSFFKIEF